MLDLAKALRITAARLATGEHFAWTHMGACNCGHLVQTITDKSPAEIHAIALQKPGDWRDQVRDYCPTSGYPMDDVIESLLALGCTQDELGHLEWLSDPKVLATLPRGSRHLDRRNRFHVIRYMRAWADLVDSLSKALDPRVREDDELSSEIIHVESCEQS